ncbi:MAG: hypothetical protein ACRC37_02950, partial [Lentisphaeria bacterium]
MADFKSFFNATEGNIPSVGIFTKGDFSNVEKLLQWLSVQQSPSFVIKVIFTDDCLINKLESKICKFGIPVVALNLSDGCDFNDVIKKYNIDFGLFLHYEINADFKITFPSLCLHSADLTCELDGERLFIGSNIESVEKMIIDGFMAIRSSIYLFDDNNVKMKKADLGFVLGVSDEVELDLLGYPQEELEACFYARTSNRSSDGYMDCLEQVAL